MKATGGKGQRSIASFFQRPKEAAATGQPAAKEGPAEGHGGEPPAKRAKLSQHVAPQSTGDTPHPRDQSSAPSPVLSLPRAPSRDAGGIPSRVPHRQLKAHRKLVESEKQQEQQAAKPEKIKYTPLEQQVVALKQQYPGVLLVVEVSPCCALCRSHRQQARATLTRPASC